MVASPGSNPLRTMAPLSDEEVDELDQFLVSDATSDETMMLDTLDGYLTAIVAGPTTVMPSHWLPRVWGPTEEDAKRRGQKRRGQVLNLEFSSFKT